MKKLDEKTDKRYIRTTHSGNAHRPDERICRYNNKSRSRQYAEP